MCNICEGIPPEVQLRSLRAKFERYGWTSIYVEPDERSLSWAYTIGMSRVGHPELVVVDEPPEWTHRLFDTLAPQLLAGRKLEPQGTFELGGRTWTVLPVHRSNIRAGMLAWWPKVFPHCSCHSEPDAVQVIDAEAVHPADADGSSRVRLDQRYELGPDQRESRAQRRRREREEAKRRRQG